MPPHPSTGPVSRTGASGLWRIMLIMGLFLVMVQVNRVGGGVLATALSGTHGLAPAMIGLVTGAMFLSSAAVQLPVGLMLDRFGPRRLIVALSAVATIGMVLFGISDSALGLTIGRIMIGIGHGASITGVYLLVVAWAPPERVAGIAATVIATAGAVGGMVATAPLAIALDRFGFTQTFMLQAGASVLISILIWLFVRDHPDGMTSRRPRESPSEALRGLLAVIRDRDLRPIFVMAICFSVPFATVGGLWAGPYLRDAYGLDASTAGAVILAMVLCVNVGTFVYGPLDRIFNTRKWVVLGGVAVMVAALTTLALMPAPPLLVVIGLFGVFSLASPIFVTLAAHCRGYVPEHRVGRALTFINFLGVGFIFVMQAATGWLVEAVSVDGVPTLLGYRLVFAVIALVLALAGAVYLGSRDVKPFPKEPTGKTATGV